MEQEHSGDFATLMSHRSSPAVAEHFILHAAHPLVTSVRHRVMFPRVSVPPKALLLCGHKVGGNEPGIGLGTFLWQRKGKKLVPVPLITPSLVTVPG